MNKFLNHGITFSNIFVLGLTLAQLGCGGGGGEGKKSSDQAETKNSTNAAGMEGKYKFDGYACSVGDFTDAFKNRVANLPKPEEFVTISSNTSIVEEKFSDKCSSIQISQISDLTTSSFSTVDGDTKCVGCVDVDLCKEEAANGEKQTVSYILKGGIFSLISPKANADASKYCKNPSAKILFNFKKT